MGEARAIEQEFKQSEDLKLSFAPDASLMEEAKALFSQINKKGDGQVTKKELKEAMKKSNVIKKALKLQTVSDCSLFVDSADTNQDGSMSFEEFLAYLTLLRGSQPTSPRSPNASQPTSPKPN